MSARDPRRPALVGDEFRALIAARLARRGFVARVHNNRTLVRTRGRNAHRITFGSSRRDEPGHVAGWVALEHRDEATRRLVATWSAGGRLDGPAFALEVGTNVADPAQAAALARTIARQVRFFDWLEDPPAVAAEVARRYVPGLVDPVLIAPYLRAHLGEPAVIAYAAALLDGRPELAPAFATALDDARPDGSPLRDHGTQLAYAVRVHGGGRRVDVPPGTVRSTAGRGQRCFFGLQLRAWGEPEAAHALRTVGDDDLARLAAAQQALATPLVDSRDAARIVLARALGVDRAPRRRAPAPRLFQYHARHAPFAPPPPPRDARQPSRRANVSSNPSATSGKRSRNSRNRS